jgi:hypothetical protein
MVPKIPNAIDPGNDGEALRTADDRNGSIEAECRETSTHRLANRRAMSRCLPASVDFRHARPSQDGESVLVQNL